MFRNPSKLAAVLSLEAGLQCPVLLLYVMSTYSLVSILLEAFNFLVSGTCARLFRSFRANLQKDCAKWVV